LVEAAFAIAAPSIGMAEPEPTETTLATSAAAMITNIDLPIGRSFVLSAMRGRSRMFQWTAARRCGLAAATCRLQRFAAGRYLAGIVSKRLSSP
jgi:hypothetical protein